MRLTLAARKAIAHALAHRCRAGRGLCTVEEGCPFGVACELIQPHQWEKALGSVNVRRVWRERGEADGFCVPDAAVGSVDRGADSSTQAEKAVLAE